MADQEPSDLRSAPGSHRDQPSGAEFRLPVPRLRRGGVVSTKDREVLTRVMRDIPSFFRLLYRLARDPRVSRVDKALLGATVGYLLMPLDYIPDFVPFLGRVDDIFLLGLVLHRLLANAGMDVLLDHWDGHPDTLELALGTLERAGALLPEPVRIALSHRVR